MSKQRRINKLKEHLLADHQEAGQSETGGAAERFRAEIEQLSKRISPAEKCRYWLEQWEDMEQAAAALVEADREKAGELARAILEEATAKAGRL